MSRIHFFLISAGWDHGELIMWKTTIYSMVYTLLIKKPACSMWKQVWENATQAINTSLPCCWTDKHHWYFLVMTNPTPSHTNFVNYVSFHWFHLFQVKKYGMEKKWWSWEVRWGVAQSAEMSQLGQLPWWGYNLWFNRRAEQDGELSPQLHFITAIQKCHCILAFKR